MAEKKINADQKAQALKKPALQATIAQLEEQIGHYKEFTAQYEARLQSQKAALEKTHQEELEAVRAKAIADASETTSRVLREQFFTLTKFLCAAANTRHAGDTESLESRAFEGVLFQVYGGNQSAVDSMVKLVDGADEKVVTVEGETLELSCKLYLPCPCPSKSFTHLHILRRRCEAGVRQVCACGRDSRRDHPIGCCL